ncbi:MAG: hypothetical protein GC162_10815 [Planctomycetes bacterium]|nr:hypothetical protein [Planctomycetota bacterium]
MGILYRIRVRQTRLTVDQFMERLAAHVEPITTFRRQRTESGRPLAGWLTQDAFTVQLNSSIWQLQVSGKVVAKSDGAAVEVTSFPAIPLQIALVLCVTLLLSIGGPDALVIGLWLLGVATWSIFHTCNLAAIEHELDALCGESH